MYRFIYGVVLALLLTAMPALAASTAGKAVKDKKTNVTLLPSDMKIRGQKMQIQSALKADKITQAQAKNLLSGIQEVQKKQADFFRQNGKHILTADQQGQLEQMLVDRPRRRIIRPVAQAREAVA